MKILHFVKSENSPLCVRLNNTYGSRQAKYEQKLNILII